MPPLVTVMMPCYDSAGTLPLALASLRGQTCEDWECVLVDDGSHDNPRRVVEELGDSRIRFFRFSTNRGRGAARQLALEAARGEFLCMLDADDWYYPTKLGRQLELLATAPEVGVASTGVAVIDERGTLLGVRPRAGADAITFNRFRGVGLSPIPSNPCMIRMGLARSVRFDASLARSQDSDYLVRVLRSTTYAFDPRPSYVYLEPPQRFADKVWSSARYTTKFLWGQRSVDRVGAASAIARVWLKAALTSALHGAGLGGPLAKRRSRLASTSEAADFSAARATVAQSQGSLIGIS